MQKLVTTVQELNNRRSLQRSTLKRDSVGAHVEERTRRIVSYGHPEFQIDDMVKILKDTAPGTHPRFSYDKLGVIKNVIDGNGSNANLYTVKILFESCTEEVDEMWLRRYNVDEAMSDRLSRKRTLTEKNMVNLRRKTTQPRMQGLNSPINGINVVNLHSIDICEAFFHLRRLATSKAERTCFRPKRNFGVQADSSRQYSIGFKDSREIDDNMLFESPVTIFPSR